MPGQLGHRLSGHEPARRHQCAAPCLACPSLSSAHTDACSPAASTAIAYSVISPIINGLACFSFFLLYHAHKYYFIWCCDQQPWSETGGLFLPKAINHVFVGLYLEHICLATLFFLARDEEGKVRAVLARSSPEPPPED